MLSDTHCHLNLEEFDQDLDQVINNALDSGVKKILVPGIDLTSSKKAVALANKYPSLIYAAVGIHPNYSTDNDESFVPDLEKLLSEESVVAIGEIGLDYYRNYSRKSTQKHTFALMLSLAKKHQKPICIHQRNSEDEIIRILDKWYDELSKHFSPLAYSPGVFHSFGGSEKIHMWASEREFYFGIGGYITYDKASLLREKLQHLNTCKMILETDSPYLSPVPLRGNRNEPANLKYIAHQIAVILVQDSQEISEITTRNAAGLFRWE